MIDLTPDSDSAPAKRIRFVSDLHLGHPGGFLKRADDFRVLIEDCDVLVVCGDFVEMRSCPYKEEGERLRDIFARECDEKHVKLIVLSGNHDPEEPDAIATAYEGRVLALHGHELFKEVAPWGREYLYNKPLAKKVMNRYPDADQNLDQCLERAQAMSLFVPPIVKSEEKAKSGLVGLLKNACWPPTRAFRIILAWLTMRGRIHRFTQRFFPQVKIVCYGHLHRRDIYRCNGRVYINTGALFKHAKAYGVDIEGGQVTIRAISKDGWGEIASSFSLEG